MNVFTRFSTACLVLLTSASVGATSIGVTPTPPANRFDGFALAEPAYDCSTRQLTLRANGGNGSPVEYMVVGQSRWSSDATLIVDAALAADASPVTVLARQLNGSKAPTVASRSISIAKLCGGDKAVATPAQPARSTGLSLNGLTYDCGSRQLSIQTSGGNGAGVEYMVAGQSRWGTDASLTLDENLANNTPVLMVLARQQSETGTPFVVRQVLDLAQRCGTDKANTARPDATPTGLRMATPGYDCATNQITIRTDGGNGTPVEYLIVGQSRWSITATEIVEASAISEAGTVVILARQKNAQGVPTVVQQTVSTRALCK